MIAFYDASGRIVAAVSANSPNDLWTLTHVPTGTTSVYVDDAKFPDVWSNLTEWQIQSGEPVSVPTPDATKLANAKTVRKAFLLSAFEQAIFAGFPSSADGTARTYSIDPTALGKWTGTLSNINSGLLTTNVTVKDVTGVKVTLTPTQFKQFALDGFTYYNNHEQNLWTKEDAVNAATTVDAVNAVVY